MQRPQAPWTLVNTAGIYLGGLSRGGTARLAPGQKRERKQKTEELKPEAPGWEGMVRMGPERACPRGRSPAVSPSHLASFAVQVMEPPDGLGCSLRDREKHQPLSTFLPSYLEQPFQDSFSSLLFTSFSFSLEEWHLSTSLSSCW